MCVSRFTVMRAFAQAEAMGVIRIESVRHGKRPQDQHNEYNLIPEKMREHQRLPRAKHVAPVLQDVGTTNTEHVAPVQHVSDSEHVANRKRTRCTRATGSTNKSMGPNVAIAGSPPATATPTPTPTPTAKATPTASKYEKEEASIAAANRGSSDAELGHTRTQNHRPPYVSANSKSSRRDEQIKTQARSILGKRGHDPEFISRVLNLIQKRARTAPVSPHYYVTAFDSESFEDWHTFLKLDLVHQTVEHATATGRTATDVLRERLSPEET